MRIELESNVGRHLEALVDSNTLADVLSALVEIAYAKGDHLRSNWQDSDSARVWERAGKAIDRAILKVNV